VGQASGYPRMSPSPHRIPPSPQAGRAVASRNPRIALLKEADAGCAELVQRLLRSSVETLSLAWGAGEFAFTLAGVPLPGGAWRLEPAGASVRHTAIAALGLLRLPEQVQRRVLGGGDAQDLAGRLARGLESITDLADVALVCWAAAEARHADLPRALARLAELDAGHGPVPMVTAAWVVTALTAARSLADVEEPLAAARQRMLAARGVLFPHTTGLKVPWYRAHAGTFADQIFPVQALARLHGTGGDPQALAVAQEVAAAICGAQGEAGQWWCHYDYRTGAVIEGYPVYSMHQHAVAPMALLDLAESGGHLYLEPICQGLRWLLAPPETGEGLIHGDPPVIWRGVTRGSRQRLAGRLRAAATRVRPGWQFPAAGKFWPAGTVDRECRPCEMGWLLYAWLAPTKTAGPDPE
jgi:hypothetical protein